MPTRWIALAAVLAATPFAARAQTWEAALGAGSAAAASEAQRAKIEPRCLEFGRHTETLPDFDPMWRGSRECLADPFQTPGSFEAAWSALVARVRSEGGAPVPYATPFEKGFQQAIAAGSAAPEKLDARSHWGDFAVLYLQEDGASARGMTIVTYRAYLSREPGADRVKAERMDFSALPDGTLDVVEYRDGELSADGKVMMWAPTRVVGQRDWMSGVYDREWRQLVAAMARPR